jgi:hypothetical protein
MDRWHCCGWKQKTIQLLVFAETPTGKPIAQACKRTAGCWNDKPLGYPTPQQLLHINIFMLHWSVMQLMLNVQKLHQNSRKCVVVSFHYLAVQVNILFETMVHQTMVHQTKKIRSSVLMILNAIKRHTIFKTNNPYPLVTVSTNPLLYIQSQCHKICMLTTTKIKL